VNDGHKPRRAQAKLLLVLLAILAIKTIFLVADSRPAYFFGDSESYLGTATIKYIPPDRSFLYGLFLRRVAFHAHSLQAMVDTQVLLSAFAAWLLSITLVRFFSIPLGIAAFFGLLCAVEPLQLLMERYVMTETLATFAFAVHFAFLLAYVCRESIWTLLSAQAFGVLLITFRISFLPEVLVNSVLAPLLTQNGASVLRAVGAKLKRRAVPVPPPQIGLLAAHLALSLVVSQGLLTAYKNWNGRLSHREPALLYSSGAFLLSDLSPLVEPQDFPVPEYRKAIFDNLHVDTHDLLMRPAQHFMVGGLWFNIQKAFPNPREADRVATATAMHALLRQPGGAIRLALQTFALYFHPRMLKHWLLIDEGYGNRMSPNTRNWLHRVYGVSNPKEFEPSVSKAWHMTAFPWYWMVLCTLAASPLLPCFSRGPQKRLTTVCAVTALLFLAGATVLVDRPTPRFLTTDAWLALLILGIGAGALAHHFRPSSFKISSRFSSKRGASRSIAPGVRLKPTGMDTVRISPSEG